MLPILLSLPSYYKNDGCNPVQGYRREYAGILRQFVANVASIYGQNVLFRLLSTTTCLNSKYQINVETDMASYLKRQLKKINIIKKVKRQLDFLRRYIRDRNRARYATNVGYDINKLYWINPERIKYIGSTRTERPLSEIGLINGGDWDKNRGLFEELIVYKAFESRIKKNLAWENTDFYNKIAGRIKNGSVLWNCHNVDDFIRRLKSLDELILNIKTNGYKTQQELQQYKKGVEESICNCEDEIRVNIARDGEILFADGRHRLCIAKLLNLSKIPVKISRRHQQWVDLRKEIISYSQNLGGKINQPLLHPDLEDIPYYYGHTRWDLIEPEITGAKGKALDIGANWGYFSHRLESLGYECTAVEAMPKDACFLEKLRDAEKKKFKIVNKSILEYKEESKFNIVLALNILHNYFETRKDYEKLIQFLQRLECEKMFFQPHLINEPQMNKAYKNFNEVNYVEFIEKHTGLKSSRLLGKDEKGRSLYVLSHG